MILLCKNMDESHQHNVEQKSHTQKELLLRKSIYIPSIYICAQFYIKIDFFKKDNTVIQ